MTSPDNEARPKVGAGRPVDVLTTLPAAMTGRASPAKAALGDTPVFAYISSLPQPQRSIAERVDALAAETLPGLQRSVKWGMAWYGVGDGWCFSCGVDLGSLDDIDERQLAPWMRQATAIPGFGGK